MYKPKNILLYLASGMIALPALIPAFSIIYAEEKRVCGIDGSNYPSQEYAEKKGIRIDYEFPCESPESEDGLYERETDFEMAGMLLESYNGSSSSQYYIKSNKDGKPYLIFADEQRARDEDMPGDQIFLRGKLNMNTGIVRARELRNLSASPYETSSCQISHLDSRQDRFLCDDYGAQKEFFLLDDSRLLVGLKNPARFSDLSLGDQLRIRYQEDGGIIQAILARRAGKDFLKNHIFEGAFRFVSLSYEGADMYITAVPQERIEAVDILQSGQDAGGISMAIDDDTEIKKKYFGHADPLDFKPGDMLRIVGRQNDNGQYRAIMVKNQSIWK